MHPLHLLYLFGRLFYASYELDKEILKDEEVRKDKATSAFSNSSFYFDRESGTWENRS
jgi:hypothetical protein